MLEMLVYAERVPKVSKGNTWEDNEVLRLVLLFLCSPGSQNNTMRQHNTMT